MREWLRNLRISKGLSQQNVSEKINLTQQYYSSIENGDRQTDMSLSIMQKLSDAFNVPLEYIVDQESKINKLA